MLILLVGLINTSLWSFHGFIHHCCLMSLLTFISVSLCKMRKLTWWPVNCLTVLGFCEVTPKNHRSEWRGLVLGGDEESGSQLCSFGRCLMLILNLGCFYQKNVDEFMDLIAFSFFKDWFIWEKERIYMQRVGAEGERESWADTLLNMEPTTGLHPITLESWPQPKSSVVCLTSQAT